MKVGDLVKYKNLMGFYVNGKFISKEQVGIIIETGVYVGRCDLKVAWNNTIATAQSSTLEVVNEKRNG